MKLFVEERRFGTNGLLTAIDRYTPVNSGLAHCYAGYGYYATGQLFCEEYFGESGRVGVHNWFTIDGKICTSEHYNENGQREGEILVDSELMMESYENRNKLWS